VLVGEVGATGGSSQKLTIPEDNRKSQFRKLGRILRGPLLGLAIQTIVWTRHCLSVELPVRGNPSLVSLLGVPLFPLQVAGRQAGYCTARGRRRYTPVNEGLPEREVDQRANRLYPP
jgi:hypothetical protein